MRPLPGEPPEIAYGIHGGHEDGCHGGTVVRQEGPQKGSQGRLHVEVRSGLHVDDQTGHGLPVEVKPAAGCTSRICRPATPGRPSLC